MRNLDSESISGFALTGSFLTTGILMVLLLNGSFSTTIANIFITISIIGFTIELSKLINEDSTHENFWSDIGVAVLLGVGIYWGSVVSQKFGWINNVTISIAVIFSLIMFYGLFRGVIGISAVVSHSERRFLSLEVFVQSIFKINGTNQQPNGYLFDLINVGYSFFAITAVNWDGEEVEVINDFNGIIEKTTTKNKITEIVSRHETLAISIKVEPNANTEGYLEINGFDLNQNEFKYKSPLMIIEKGKITNGIKVTNQFMQ